MAVFQQGLENIGNAAATVTVTYPAAFTTTPEVVIAVIQNTVDGAPSAITAEVTTTTTTGFVVKLSASTNSVNYQLAWVAGSANLMFDVIAQMGFRTSQLAEQTSAPLDNDYFPMVITSPLLQTVLIKWSTVYGLFGRRVSAPAAPGSSGDVGQWAADANWFYTYYDGVWGRSPRQTDAWDWNYPAGNVWGQEGRITMTSGQNTVSVVFDQEFGGTPLVTFSIENTATGDKLLLQGILTTVDYTGFTVTLNTAPDSSSYVLNWRATDDSAP